MDDFRIFGVMAWKGQPQIFILFSHFLQANGETVRYEP